MKIDNETHRELLLKFIDSAPVTGAMQEVLALAAVVSELRKAVETAEVSSGLDPAVEAYAER